MVEPRLNVTTFVDALTEETVMVSLPRPVKERETVNREASAVVDERVSL
jgi:hypothetical protein